MTSEFQTFLSSGLEDISPWESPALPGFTVSKLPLSIFFPPSLLFLLLHYLSGWQHPLSTQAREAQRGARVAHSKAKFTYSKQIIATRWITQGVPQTKSPWTSLAASLPSFPPRPRNVHSPLGGSQLPWPWPASFWGELPVVCRLTLILNTKLEESAHRSFGMTDYLWCRIRYIRLITSLSSWPQCLQFILILFPVNFFYSMT